MINARKIGGYWKSSIHLHSEKGGKALILVSFTDYPKGGLRWIDKEVTPYG